MPPQKLPRSGLSIRWRLSLLISALTAVVIVVCAVSAYRRMQETAVEAAAERLTGVAGQLSRMIRGSIPQYTSALMSTARSPALAQYLAAEGQADPSAALEALAAAVTTGRGAELRNAAGHRVLATSPDLPASDEPDDALRELFASADTAGVGRLRSVNDSLTAPVAARVVSSTGTLGWVVTWPRVAGTGQADIEALVGEDVQLRLANTAGDLWADLAHPVEPPRSADVTALLDGGEYVAANGQTRVAGAATIPGAPWSIILSQSRARVTADARESLLGIVLVGLVVMGLAIAATWVLADRFTAPVLEVAAVAERLADGDFRAQAPVHRGDEVGVLAHSFNTMAESLAANQAALEEKVRELAELGAVHRALSHRLTHMLTASPDVIYQLRENGDGTEFTWVSENVERMLGWSPAEVMLDGWWDANLHPDDAGAAPIAGRGSNGDAARELRLRHRDGRWRWIRDRQRVDGGDGTVVGAWSDVTELRSLEEQFRQAQKLEAVGRLAGGIAHDFNNVATVILGEVDMALAREPATTPLRDSLDQIRAAAVRASMLTRQLLTFSRRQLTESTTFSFNDVVHDVKDMLDRLIGEDIELQFRLAEPLGRVSADRNQIEQVLVNLVINARDAMPDGGRIVVQTHDVHLDDEYVRSHADAKQGDYVALVVSDSGTGIPDDVKPHLFEPFFTTKGPGKGTGLGLATCYGIARQFGGHIGVYTELGVGTAMKLYLPRTQEPERPAEVQTPSEEMPRGTETILLVEDEAQVRAIVARMLRAQGYTVIQAPNGEDALRILSESAQHVDLLLTDLVMPRMSGRELADQVKSMRPGLRVLFTSGYTEDVIVQNRLLAHDVMLLHKPFTRGALAAKVRHALDTPASPAQV